MAKRETKAYYTGITDILREYLSTRYPVKALEMTSQEILDRMIRESLPEKSIAAQRHPDHRRFRKIRQIHTGCGSERNGLHGRLLFHRRDQSGRGGTARRRDRTDQNRGKEGGRRMIRHTIITCLLLLAAGMAADRNTPNAATSVRATNFTESGVLRSRDLLPQSAGKTARFLRSELQPGRRAVQTETLRRSGRTERTTGCRLGPSGQRGFGLFQPGKRPVPAAQTAGSPSKRTKTRCG